MTDNKGDIVFSSAMRSWDYGDPKSAGHGETWQAEVALDNSQSRLTVFLTDGQGRRQEIAIEINGQQVGLYAHTEAHEDLPLIAAKIGQNEAYVFEMLTTSDKDNIVQIDANGFSKAETMEFSDAAPSAKL
jgi:hypothetical protein